MRKYLLQGILGLALVAGSGPWLPQRPRPHRNRFRPTRRGRWKKLPIAS